jgi:ABC-type transport system involved in multi-copper enzyme maturation permease subunit
MKTLLWKEWREHRLFFFLAVGIIFLTRFLLWFFRKELTSYYEEALGIFAHFIIPILFCLFLGVIPFTNEFTRNTKPFLLSHPVTAAKIFWMKFFSGLFLLIILITLSHFVFGVNFGSLYSESNWPLIYLFLSAIILYSSAFLSSLLLKNTLPSILITPFILLSGIFVIMPLTVALFYISPSLRMFVFLTCSAIVAVFLVISFTAWRKSAVKDLSCWKTVPLTVMVILFISFLSHGILNLAVTSRLNTTIQQAKAEGFKLTLEEVIPPPVRDEENAALVYEEAFKLAERLKDRYKEEWEYMPYESRIKIKELTAEHKRTISRIMKDPEFANLYDLIEKAVNMPACRFDINYEEGPAMPLPHLAKMRMLGRLTAARAYILGWEGKHKEAWESAKVGFCLGDSLDDEPVFVSKLVRIAVDMFAMDSFQQFLDKPGEIFSFSEYQALIRITDQKNRRLTRQALEGELAFLGRPVFEKHVSLDQLFVRSSPDNGRKIRFLGNIYRSYLGSPILKEDYAFYIHAITNLMQITDEPYYLVKEKHYNWERELVAHDRFKVYKRIMSAMILPAYSRVNVQQAIYNAHLDTFKLALALRIYREDHGYYPDTLSSLAPGIIPEPPLDPFTGKDYIYRREGKGFIVYSVGPNEKDDGGIYDTKQKYDDIAFEVVN